MPPPRIIGLLLALITLVIYLPSSRHEFVVFDDPEYVTENLIVQQGVTAKGISWAFTTFHASNWHPVTWMSHMLDCSLFGLNPGAHHIVNALFHAANAALLFALLLQLTGRLWPAAVVAALFAWHPLRVESVAWIAERKDVLSLFFGLLCLLAYTKHAKTTVIGGIGFRMGSGKPLTRPAVSPSDGERDGVRGTPPTSGFYWLALLCFALGLMAKPMLVTLPCVMLLLDWWPLARFRPEGATKDQCKRLILEKLPFLLLVLISCGLTVAAQRTEAVVALEQVPLDLRLKNALVAVTGYLTKTLWPTKLAVIYPLPTAIVALKALAAGGIIVTLSVLAWHWRRTKPHLLVGWLWFLGMLTPVIGIVQVGGQAMADRYTYLPHIGLFLALVIEVSSWLERTSNRLRIGMVIAGAFGLGCIWGTTRQLSHWQNSVTLFSHTLEVTRNNPIAHINLGVALEQQGRIAEAREQYEAAVRLDPNRVQVQVNLANVLDLLGDSDAALEHYRMALQLKPNSPLVHLNLGSALVKLGRFDEARVHFETAQRLAPSDPRPLYLMGKSLLRQGRSRDAADRFLEALQRDPNHLQSLVWLARTRAADFDTAVRNGAQAVQLADRAAALTGGNDPFVLDTLAAAFAEVGRFNEAQQTIQSALQLLASVGDTNDTSLKVRLRLYQSGQPYREAFTNAVDQSPAAR